MMRPNYKRHLTLCDSLNDRHPLSATGQVRPLSVLFIRCTDATNIPVTVKEADTPETTEEKPDNSLIEKYL